MEFTSIMTESTLQEKLRANKARSISQADATATREKQQKIQQQQKLQKQKEENDVAYQKHQKDLAEYNKQKQQYDAAVKQLEAEQKRIADKIQAAKQVEQKRIADQKAINDKYDSQIVSLGSKPSKYYYKPKYYTNRYTGQTRQIGTTRESNHNAIKNYNSKVDAINRTRSTALTNFEISYSDIPATFIASARREASRSSGVNILARAQQKWDSFLAQSEYRRQSSITTAKSNAVKAREQHEKTIREYEQKRESAPIPIPSVIDKPLTKATKTRPKVYPSSYFKSVEKTPVSIFGTLLTQSNKAEKTYDTTQAQQKELFASITKASDYKQAISLREKAMEKNSYVGTANTLLYKGEKIGSSGVLIEKKLRVQEDVFEELAKPISPKKQQEIEIITVPSQNIPKPEIETSYYLPGSLEYLYGAKPVEKTRVTIPEILKGTNDNSNPLQDIADAAKNPIHNLVEVFAAIPESAKRDWDAGFKRDSLGQLPSDRHLEHEIATKLKPTLLDGLIEGKETGRSTTFNAASAFVEAGLFLAPIPITKGTIALKSSITGIKNKRKAQEIGEEIFETINEKRLAEKLEDDVIFRRVSPKLADAIKNFNRDTPVGVEKISTGSFLITAGTESKTPLPSILYNVGKNKKSTVFAPVDPDGKIMPKGIIVKGNSKKEFSDTLPLGDDVSYAPGNADNLEKISNPAISKYLKPEAMITDIDNSFLEKYPKFATFGTDKIPSSVYATTEKRNLLKGFNADVKKLDTPDSLNSKKGSTTPFEKTVKDLVNTEKRGSLQRVETNFKNTAPSKSTTTKTTPSKSTSNTKLKSPTKQSDVTIVEQVLHPNRSKIINTPMLDSLLGQRQQGVIDQTVKSPTQQTETFKMGGFLEQQIPNPKIIPKTKQEEKQKSMLYDLLVQNGKQGTKGKQDYGFIFTHPPKLTTKQTPKTTPRIKTTTKKLPVSIKIPQIGLKQRNPTPKRKRKNAAKYSIWNVDVDNIGTLPGAELVTSKSTKIFKDLDKRQKAHSKKNSEISKKTIRKSTPKKKSKKR